MARIKYAPDVAPIIGEHSGNTFQNSRIGSVMFRGQANDRSRYPWQNARKMNITHANGHWRNFSDTIKNNWVTFAATLPQPTHRNSDVFLSGYECFIKRQSYLFLNYGVSAPFMTAPSLTEFLPVTITPSVALVGGRLKVTCVLSRYNSDLDINIFSTFMQSKGIKYVLSQPRYMTNFGNSATISPNYGILYNFYAYTDARQIAAAGWHPANVSDYQSLHAFGGSSPAPYLLTSQGGSNLFGFNGTRGGWRYVDLNFQDGHFEQLNGYCILGTPLATQFTLSAWLIYIYLIRLGPAYSDFTYLNSVERAAGVSVRLVKDSTTLSNGQTGTYTGNDGTVYPTICINGKEWLAANLCETLFRTGAAIPYVSDNNTWRLMTTAALCYYNNVQSNAFSSVPPVVDITEEFIQHFGILPTVGQQITLTFKSFAKLNGQSFPIQKFNLTVL